MLTDELKEFAVRVLAEDVGRGDLSALLVEDKQAQGIIKAKEDGVLAGVVYAQALADELGCEVVWHKEDGEKIINGDILATLKGPASRLLTLERSFLNTLQHASGIASLTRKYVQCLESSGVVLLDTRKTRPGLRMFEKYAARVGGAMNHRMGLDDAVMIKDTHWAHISSLSDAINKARQNIPFTTMIEVECETVDQAKEAMCAGVNIIMCDNMSLQEIKEIVSVRECLAPFVKVEASGNITLETISEVAQTGVDAISTGSIIHQAVWLDFSMKMDTING